MPDYGPGLISGLQNAVSAYFTADEKRKEREALAAEKSAKRQDELRDLRVKAFLEGYGPDAITDTGDINPEAKFRQDYLQLKTDQRESDPYGLKALAASEAKRKSEEAQFKKNPQGKIEILGAQDRQRFDNLMMAKNAYEDAKSSFEPAGDKGLIGGLLARGKRVGFSKYAEAAGAFKEAIGRLQSGGAIGRQEEKAFLSLLPTATDPDEVSAQKLSRLEQELGSRIRGFGIDSGELEKLGYLKKPGVLLPGQQQSPQVDAEAPKPGDIDGGYRFRGGDPSDPKSWEKMSAGQ